MHSESENDEISYPPPDFEDDFEPQYHERADDTSENQEEEEEPDFAALILRAAKDNKTQDMKQSITDMISYMINVGDEKFSRTPLYYAASHGNVSMIKVTRLRIVLIFPAIAQIQC